MDYGDIPVFKDGFYVYATGQMVNEGDMIEGAQSLAALEINQQEDIIKREE